MIENGEEMGSGLAVPAGSGQRILAALKAARPTYDGSLFGPDVCRCSSHVDPHRHIPGDPYAVDSIYGDDEADE